MLKTPLIAIPTATSLILKRSKAEGQYERISVNHVAFNIKSHYKRF